jgi:hypothetical protein
MNFELPPLGRVDSTAPTQRATESANGASFSSALSEATKVNTLPSSPPDEVLEQMHEAAQVAEQLRAHDRELHFQSEGGRVAVQLRSLDGSVVRTLSPSEALDVASGEGLPG